ncbi:MAG: sugar transferase [Bacteroidia bacterium]|nr:sugar transferase [Bacteroidia bacterium]
MLKRFLDIFLSLAILLAITPILVFIAMAIKWGSKGPVFYRQVRIGKDGKPFQIFKFRTMRPDSDKLGLLTVGGRDPRITAIGYYLRKYKLDELPQFLNVLAGEMSIVGPRPEVKKYVDLYSTEQKRVLEVRPGITDYASLLYKDENDVLAKYPDPEQAYIDIVMPHKLKINLEYINNRSFWMDLKIIVLTAKGVIS